MGDERKLDKLPVWARDEITRLRRDLESSRETIRKLTGEETSRVQVEPYHFDEKPRYLKDHATVRFLMGKSGHIDVRLEGGHVLIMGSNTIVIHSRAANCAWVGPAESRS